MINEMEQLVEREVEGKSNVYHKVHIMWLRIDCDTDKKHCDGDSRVLGSSSPSMYYCDDKINKEQTSRRVYERDTTF
jgi:hypothetical protein